MKYHGLTLDPQSCPEGEDFMGEDFMGEDFMGEDFISF